MANVKVAFKFKHKDDAPPVGYKEIRCHLIFYVKMDLTRKARFVARGHMANPPTSMTYASVVSRESVQIAFLLAALNDLEVLTGDIGNAYLHAPTQEKIYYRAGVEWGNDMEWASRFQRNINHSSTHSVMLLIAPNWTCLIRALQKTPNCSIKLLVLPDG